MKMKMFAGLSVLLFLVLFPGKNVNAGEVFRTDFEKDRDATITGETGTLKPVNGCPGARSFPGKGANGTTGAVFAVDNLSDFADLTADVSKPMWNLTYHFPAGFFRSGPGAFSVMAAPRFNQISPYPKKNPGFKQYHILSARQDDTNGLSVFLFIQDGNLCAHLKLTNGQTVMLSGPCIDWKKDQWRKIVLTWDDKEKLLLMDGKVVARRTIAGEVCPFNIIMIGGCYDGSNFQGILDNISFSTEAVGVPARQPVFTDNFSQGDSAWTFSKTDGADGSVEPVKINGKTALKVVKRNHLGTLRLRLDKPLAVRPDTDYKLRGKYWTSDVSVDNGLYFRVQRGKDGGLHYNDHINRGEVYTTYSQPVNAPSGEWRSMFYAFHTKYPERTENYLNILLRGSPCTVYLTDISCDELENQCLYYSEPKERKPKETVLSDGELDKKLALRKMPVIEWQSGPDMKRLFIDGKFVPQFIHRAPTGYPEISRYKEMENAGIKLHTVGIFVGGKAGGRENISIVRERGQYQFSEAMKDVRRALRGAPDSYLILEFKFYPFKNWTDGHDGEIFRNKKGQYGVSNNLLYIDRWIDRMEDKKPAESFYPSYYATAWRAECLRALDAFFDEFDKTPFRKTVAGFFVNGGFDGQFMNNTVDYSEAARTAFRKFLEKKYGSLEGLRKAWNDPKADWNFKDVASVPDYPPNHLDKTFLDPKTEQRYADFMEFRSEGILDTLNVFADAVRKRLGPVMPGYISICDDLNGSHIDTYSMQRLTRENRYDATSCQPKYPMRRNGFIPFNSSVLDSMRIHGKSSVAELDLRTHVTPSVPSEVLREYVSYAKDINDFRSINRKLAGLQIAKNHGMWYYDMGAGYFYDKDIMEELRETGRIMEEVQKVPNTFKPDAAVIFDEKSVFYDQFRSYPMNTFYNGQLLQQYLLTSGVPYDIYYLDDLVDGKIPDYKVLVMLNTSFLNKVQRNALEKWKNAGHTIIWCYAPGFISENGFSTDAVSRLTGIRCSGKPELKRQTASKTKSSDPLAAGLESNVGLADTYRFYTDYPGGNFGRNFDMRRFTVTDPDAEILARYNEDGEAMLAVKRFKDWTSLYAAAPASVTAHLLNNCVRQAGGFVFSEPGLIAHVRSNFVSVHAARGGTYQVHFPSKGKIVCLESGKVLAEDADHLSIQIQPGETRWFKIDPVPEKGS